MMTWTKADALAALDELIMEAQHEADEWSTAKIVAMDWVMSRHKRSPATGPVLAAAELGMMTTPADEIRDAIETARRAMTEET